MTRTKSYPYTVVDVFTTEPLSGNSLAVFPEASKFDAAAMQKIARELNLTETAFVLPATRSDCAARVRIFTPTKELPFAGHPTVGTAFVLLQKGIVSSSCHEFLLEEEVGPIPLRIEAGTLPLIWLRTPTIREGGCLNGSLCARALGLEPHDLLAVEPQMLNAGNPTVVLAVKDKAAVDRAWLDLTGLRSLKGMESESFCVFVFTPTPDGAYSRMFAPESGIPEDPATGSSTGPLAYFMMRHGLVPKTAGTRFVSEQGTKMGRRSLLHVEIHGDSGADGIDVGGHVTPLVEAVMTADPV
ncbi:MAG: PhzF family phenazine biosynthesis protein [Acidobacteriaceae bacterium]|nr:PhzF family phenazine biosynthesis protein [Acidobacteriaceae bacterium]